MWLDDFRQPLSVCLAVKRQAQFSRKLAASLGKIKHLVGGYSQSAGKRIFTDLTFDKQQLVFFDDLAMLFPHLIENCNFNLTGTVVQRHRRHSSAPGLLYAHTVDNTGKQHRLKLRLNIRQCLPHQSNQLVAIR